MDSNTRFVKICPACQTENRHKSLYCSECSMDLGTTTPTEVGAPQTADVLSSGISAPGSEPSAGTPPSSPDAAAVSHVEPVGTRRVNSDLSPRPGAAPALVLELISNPAIRFRVRDGDVVGRTDKSDVILTGLPKFEFVSSRMARFFRQGGQWFVTNAVIPPTNFIQVDGDRYMDDTEVAIENGSIVGLPLDQLRVRLEEK